MLTGAQHRPTGSETTPPYAAQSSRFGTVEDDVDVWCYAVLELHARNNDNDDRGCDGLNRILEIHGLININLSKNVGHTIKQGTSKILLVVFGLCIDEYM